MADLLTVTDSDSRRQYDNVIVTDDDNNYVEKNYANIIDVVVTTSKTTSVTFINCDESRNIDSFFKDTYDHSCPSVK